MKMKLTFLLVASVFFVSCGMPTIFYPSTSEYSLTQTTPDPGNVKGKLSMNLDNPGVNYDHFTDSLTKGPSMMFFYTFDDENISDYPISSYTSRFSSKFAEKYILNKYEGIAIQTNKEVLSIKIEDKDVYLYGVNPKIPNKRFTAEDQYVLYADNQTNGISLDPFTLSIVSLGTPADGYALQLSWDHSNSSTTFTSNILPTNMLYAFDGQAFPLIQSTIQNKIERDDNHEYEYVDIDSTGIQLHLFVAFFISNPFTNNFWSKLTYLGEIPIALQVDP